MAYVAWEVVDIRDKLAKLSKTFYYPCDAEKVVAVRIQVVVALSVVPRRNERASSFVHQRVPCAVPESGSKWTQRNTTVRRWQGLNERVQTTRIGNWRKLGEVKRICERAREKKGRKIHRNVLELRGD